MKILTLIFCCFALNVEAYVLSRGISQTFVKWSGSSVALNFYLNTDNDDGIIDSEVATIVENSKNEWSDISNFNISIINTTGSEQNGRNDIFFSSDPYYFSGSGVVGLTVVAFREDTGQILETDIALNEIHLFKDRSTLINKLPDDYFLGNVLTHEIGHALGISHSEVHRSTMFYKLSHGQAEISEDDRSAANNYYPISSYTGSISGNVFGGSSIVGIFGVQVQAISASTGKTIGSVLSEENGDFLISGLPKNDQYYLYLSPVRVLSSIPSMYSDVRKNFCNSNTDFRGSFYSSCYSSDRGLPMGVDLTDAVPSVNIGKISIKCGLDMPVEYFLAKGGGTYELKSLDIEGNAGNAFVGFFSDAEVTSGNINNEADNIDIDLRSLNVPSNDLYLDLKIIHQDLFSELKLNMDITFTDNTVITYPTSVGADGVVFDSEKNIELDIHGRFLLDSVDFSRNYFKLAIRPRKFSNHWTEGDVTVPDVSIRERNFFQEFTDLKDSQKFYFLIANISQRNLDGSYTVVNTKRYNLSDNKNCPDAPSSYVVKASLYKETVTPAEVIKKDDPLAISCGTIDLDNDDQGDGMMMMTLFGFLCTLLCVKSSEYLS